MRFSLLTATSVGFFMPEDLLLRFFRKRDMAAALLLTPLSTIICVFGDFLLDVFIV